MKVQCQRIDFKIKSLEIHGKKIKIQIWDTCSQERFNFVQTSYYKGIHGFILVYDITTSSQLKDLISYLKYVEVYGPKKCYKILIGNKSDLENKREVSFEEAKKFAEENKMKFFETSAKDGTNVLEFLTEMTKDIIDNHYPLISKNEDAQLNKKKCSII